jgi:hypothetical protein
MRLFRGLRSTSARPSAPKSGGIYIAKGTVATSRVFINLPKNIYPNKIHNFQFKSAMLVLLPRV